MKISGIMIFDELRTILRTRLQIVTGGQCFPFIRLLETERA